jgi:hypothetical protein
MDKDSSISCELVSPGRWSKESGKTDIQHAFAVPEHKRGGAYNYMTYTMFDQVFWRAIAGQVNRFRKNTCGIEATNFDKLEQHKGELLAIAVTLVDRS